MKITNTQSFFVKIYEVNNEKIVRRKKRKGLHAYPRTLSLKSINKVLEQTSVSFPKIYLNGINYVYEEFINSTQDINNIANKQLMNHVIEYITNLYNINCKRKNLWNNNSGFLKFQIDNLKNVLKAKKIKNLDVHLYEIDELYQELDNSRKLCFIHGDIHKENMIINDNFYLIDWELATFGDLAYELAMHFVLMDYSAKEKEVFINKLCENIDVNIEDLTRDVDVYIKFEKYRKFILNNKKHLKN